MQKGLGIAALIVAILAIGVPLVGTWLTVVAALMAAFAYGPGLGFAIAGLVVNVLHILFLSPLLWATQGMMSLGASAEGVDIVFLPWLLLAIQVGAAVLLFVLNNKNKGATPVGSA